MRVDLYVLIAALMFYNAMVLCFALHIMMYGLGAIPDPNAQLVPLSLKIILVCLIVLLSIGQAGFIRIKVK